MNNDMAMTFENVFKNHKKTSACKESLDAYFTIFNKNKSGILALHSFYQKEIKSIYFHDKLNNYLSENKLLSKTFKL